MSGGVVTIPNVISVVRLGLVPVFLWLLATDEPAAAGWLLGAIGATDWVDGFLARRLGQVSTVGKVLDPLADRLAIAAALIGGLVWDVLPGWYAVAVLVREVVVAAGALYGARHGIRLDVRRLGKAATFLVYGALAAFFVGRGGDLEFFEVVAWVTGIPGLVLYYIVAVRYAADLRRALAKAPGSGAR